MMRLSTLSFGLSILVCQSSWLAAFAQGDPVITPTNPQPKVEIIETPNNNQAFFQSLQNFQNQQNAFFNNPALNLNPSITGLDQRSGLIQNSTNVNMFGVNGLAINSYNVPKINNSNLMAVADVVGWSKDLANFLIKTDPKINIDRDLIPKLNNTSTPHLISALVMALGLPQDLLIDLVGRATSGALDSVRNSLIQLAAAIKTGKITPADAQKALLQIVSGAQQMKSSMVYAPPASNTTTPTTVVKQISSISGPTTVVSSTGGTPISTTTVTSVKQPTALPKITISAPGVTATEVPNTTVNPITTATKTPTSNQPINGISNQNGQMPKNAITSLNGFVNQPTEKTETTLVEISNQMKNIDSGIKPGTTATTTPATTNSSNTVNNKQAANDAAKDKLEQAQNNIETAQINRVTGGENLKPGANVQTVGAVLNNPAAFAAVISNAINGSLGGSINSVGDSIVKALGLATSTSSAKAISATTTTFPPGVPDPVALINGAMIQGTLATMKINPIVGQTLVLKAALGHFNNNPALPALNKLLSTPNLPPEIAQALVVKFIELSAKPGDIPVRAIVSSAPSSSAASSNPEMNALIKQIDTMMDQALGKLVNVSDGFSKMLDAMQKSLQESQQTLQKVQFKG